MAALFAVAVTTALAVEGERPEISGNTWNGEVLSSSPAGDSAVYKWQRCDPTVATCGDNTDRTDPDWEAVINLNSDPNYTLTDADVGMMIRVQAKGTSLGEQFVPSAPVGPILAGPPADDPPVNLSAPTISGDATEGKSVFVDPGEWEGDPTFTYSWERCALICTPIPGADETRYDPTADDVGSSLRVRVTASNDNGSTSEYSEMTGEVAVAPPVLKQSAVIDPSCPLPVMEPGEEPDTVDSLTNVPVGTRIDVAQCAAELITVRNRSGKTQTVNLAGGAFRFAQRGKRKAIVLLKLTGRFSAAPTVGLSAAGSGLAQAAGKRFRRCKRIFGARKCRKLVAKGDCLCSTSGVFASGSVRGSKWYVQDGPGYTFAKAIVHKLLVKDRIRNKKVLLKPGQHYIARKGKPLGCAAWSPGVC